MTKEGGRDEFRPPMKSPVNYEPLSPIGFLHRSALAFGEKIAVIDGERRITYREFERRSHRLAQALVKGGLRPGDTVAVMAANVPAMIEVHFGVPMAGCVLNTINTRLDASAVAFILQHGGARIVIASRQFEPSIREANRVLEHALPIIVVEDHVSDDCPYEQLLASTDDECRLPRLDDEWQPITLSYTSGTTGDPKGVLCHHRAAYLNTLGVAMACHLDAKAVYLWTLPMFHCNGWDHIWAVTACGGTHVCLRQVDPIAIFDVLVRENVTHFSAAPVVLTMLLQAATQSNLALPRDVIVLTGGAVPPSATIDAIERLGLRIKNIYGLTESTGPSLICEWQPDWRNLPVAERARLNSRQGLPLVSVGDAIVGDPSSCNEVEWDGKQLGEILLRGNTIMLGYLNNPAASEQAFGGGWFHTGDLAVRHPDGYIEIKDRAKDIIISGGENISSVEIEEVLYSHPAVVEAAVVARPDAKWGEHPCAFVTLRSDVGVQAAELIAFCRQRLAHFKAPKTVVFGALPKTETGKIKKFELRERARSL